MRLPPALLLAALATAPCARPAGAQTSPSAPTNAEVFARLAGACVAEAGALPSPLRVAVAAPYLRSGVVTGLVARGTRVRVAQAGSTQADTAGAQLVLAPEGLAVAYARAGRGRLRRTATLRARLTLDDADGARTLDRSSEKTAVDEIASPVRSRLEDPALPETVGTGPTRSGLSRAVQTGVAAAAVVVSTLLLFSLRSQ